MNISKLYNVLIPMYYTYAFFELQNYCNYYFKKVPIFSLVVKRKKLSEIILYQALHKIILSK